MSLPTAPLGRNGPKVNRLGFGAMGLSAFYGKPKPDDERLAVFDRAYELGERFWDTSDVYGDNELLIGKWFAANPEKRVDIFLATKFAAKDGGASVDSSPEYAKQAIDTSLKRLGVEHVDLYYVHRVDQKTPIELTVQALADLVNLGKIKYIGLSEISSDTLRRAHRVHPITAVQIEYSPFVLDIESKQIDLLNTCRELGVAVVAYSPLSRGMLTGTLKSPDDLEEGDFRRFAPRFSKENFPKNLKLVDHITEMAKAKGVTPGQLTLAWLLAQGEDIFPIPGTTKKDRLEENVGSLKVSLTKEEEAEIRKACEEAEIAGARYPEDYMKSCYADTPALEHGSGETAAGSNRKPTNTADIMGGV
ncbi:Tas oxidoreductase related to aryl-alcohol dehydrogenase [Pyrenophora tritici-repentis]|uniref:Aldo/keto reductase n=2 Tax=Pyrenophora tritici-repentis TaxID=45151 RepID=A0A2W1EI34_9PLEO|nr:aldo/keto reductase [Pyrenophora tritici-repentis Pt-1C-BFP]KAA8619727.1 Aldo/keto reductase [Pyrenophora tritici-repentis]EDU47025.1 aldo/keto reductase [Pyrenophora tritici-repentis Pt-1C-BFP]KAF7447867.1 Aldo/keto reductase [Pyrenophora tritici-repentis]KAF7571566.1 Tas, oxidoreductase (related to aryl-alcohol dehydrogenase) [Pyrenophora tritici-repentis]KAG9385207.1 Aldo/keto reductase [Pyrenophora tritici-repentis]